MTIFSLNKQLVCNCKNNSFYQTLSGSKGVCQMYREYNGLEFINLPAEHVIPFSIKPFFRKSCRIFY